MADYLARGGMSVSRQTALIATKVAVKTTAGYVFGCQFKNTTTADAYVHIYDAASGDVTVGTTVPTFSWWVPPSSGYDVVFRYPVRCGTAITMAATTTMGGSASPATGLEGDLFYT